MKRRTMLICGTLLMAALWAVSTAQAAVSEKSKVGSVVHLRGTATISRAETNLSAKVRDTIELRDIISTGARSRAKLLFVDESILTLSSGSKASVKEFVSSREGGGASIFNLLEGSMRAVVGKNKFEVHTPTLVAAARGTVIDFTSGMLNGKPYTTVTVLEGTVTVQSTDPNMPGTITLKAGQSITLFSGTNPNKARITRFNLGALPPRSGQGHKGGKGPGGGPGGGPGEGQGGGEGNGEGNGQQQGEGNGEGNGQQQGEGNGQGAPAEEGSSAFTYVSETSTLLIGTSTSVLPPIKQVPTVPTTPATVNVQFPK